MIKTLATLFLIPLPAALATNLNQIGQFASHDIDQETGLVYANARYYDNSTANFLTPDPLFISFPNLCAMQRSKECNLYSYSQGNPVSFNDPTGFVSENLQARARALQTRFRTLHQRARNRGISAEGLSGLASSHPRHGRAESLPNSDPQMLHDATSANMSDGDFEQQLNTVEGTLNQLEAVVTAAEAARQELIDNANNDYDAYANSGFDSSLRGTNNEGEYSVTNPELRNELRRLRDQVNRTRRPVRVPGTEFTLQESRSNGWALHRRSPGGAPTFIYHLGHF